MARQKTHIIADFSNGEVKRRALAVIGCAAGMYEFTFEPRRPTRSLRANAFWWAAVCTPFADFLSESDTRRWTPEQAHEFLKCRILGEEAIVEPQTGEVIGHRLPDTHTMDVDAFSDFVDRAIAYIDTEYGPIVAQPQPWRQEAGVTA